MATRPLYRVITQPGNYIHPETTMENAYAQARMLRRHHGHGTRTELVVVQVKKNSRWEDLEFIPI